MFLPLLLGFIGLFVRGFPGLLLGMALGWLLSRIFRALLLRGLRSIQSQFLESTFAVMGALCKADGVVTRDEIDAAEQMFQRLHLAEAQVRVAKAAFQRGKSADFDLDAEVDRFAVRARGSRALIQTFLQVQLVAVAADGEVHPAEHAMFVHIARRLGLSELEIRQLEALLRLAASRGAANSSRDVGPPATARVNDAYAVIGVSPDTTDEAVKRAYRKLITENHPDKLAAKGLPESMREVAEERAREINAAYDLIRRARGTS